MVTIFKKNQLNNQIAEKILWDTGAYLHNAYTMPWFPIRCPKCNEGMISNKFASSLLICLFCGAEFRMIEVSK